MRAGFLIACLTASAAALLLAPAPLRADDTARVEAIYARALAFEKAGRIDELVAEAEKLLYEADRAVITGYKDNTKARNLYRQLAATYLSYAAGKYNTADQYDKALAAGLKAVGPLEFVFGRDDHHVASCLTEIGDAYYYKEQYAEALPYHQRALDISVKTHGEVHDETDTALRDVALTLAKLERYTDAQAVYKRRLALAERRSGAESEQVATILQYLGHSLWNQGIAAGEPETEQALAEESRLKGEATKQYERVYAIRKRVLGAEHADTLTSASDIALGYQATGRHDDAARLYGVLADVRARTLGEAHADTIAAISSTASNLADAGRGDESIAIRERLVRVLSDSLGESHVDTVAAMSQAATALADAGQYDKLVLLRERMLRAKERANVDPAEVAAAHASLADAHWDNGRQDLAREQYDRAMAVHEKAFGADDPTTIYYRWCAAKAIDAAGDSAEAARLYEAILADRRRALGDDHLDTVTSMLEVAQLRIADRSYDEAQSLLKQALAVRERQLGDDHLDVAATLFDLGNLYITMGRYIEAEPLLQRAATIRQDGGASPTDIAAAWAYLGTAYQNAGRYREAEDAYRRQLASAESSADPTSTEAAYALTNLALTLEDQGRYVEAEPLFRRALDLRRERLPADHADVATSLDNLGLLYRYQERFAESKEMHRAALAIWEKADADSADVAAALNNLANVCYDQGRHDEELPLRRRSIDIWRKAFGDDHINVAVGVTNLALLYSKLEQHDDAIAQYERGFPIAEKILGRDHPDLVQYLTEFGEVYTSAGRAAEAEPWLDRAVALAERPGVRPIFRFKAYYARAQAGWQANRSTEAVSDLRRAMDLAEDQRTTSSGAEQERATYFTQFSKAFETMVDWQVEQGDAAEALLAIERARARSLVDELSLAGSDLRIGRPASERDALAQREAEIKAEIAAIEQQLAGAAAEDHERQKLEGQLEAARTRLYEHYRDERSSSPIYGNLLSSSAGPPRLSQLQRLAGGKGRLYVYMIGQEGGYLLAISPEEASLFRLSVDDAAAAALGVDTGPVTEATLEHILQGVSGHGLIADLAHPERALSAMPRLAALWTVLVPESERQPLVTGAVDRLFVVPDGPLALLPFEALVVRMGPPVEHLLDVGPPILYTPSATVLNNLASRRAVAVAGREAVLSVGDPAYPRAGEPRADTVGQLAARSSFSMAGGSLARLPFTALESTWVAEVFRKLGADVELLQASAATEAHVRSAASGRRVLHLACHGLTDQSFGNLFGALALAPGADPAGGSDDGFLTLAEIYELNLEGCELAILSACETNFGPQQKGEGVWALSRGFLVAGAKRVVASNWLVDDEAGASLISYFCGGVANSERAGKVDFARDLQAAKRWVRNQPKWQSPYYWATFVLVGPN